MKDFDDKWRRLTAAARHAPAVERATAPYGFATRVAARAMSKEQPAVMALFGRFSLRALYAACLLTLAGVTANYLAFAGTVDDEQGLIDPVSEVFSNAS